MTVKSLPPLRGDDIMLIIIITNYEHDRFFILISAAVLTTCTGCFLCGSGSATVTAQH